MPYLIFPPLFLTPGFSILSSDWAQSTRAIFLGVTLAAYPLGQFIGSPILGSMSDEYGRKPLISATLAITAAANFLTGISVVLDQLWLLIFSRFIAGFMEGNIAIARAMCADLKLLSKHETLGKVNAASAIGYLVGPLIGALLAEKKLNEGFTIATPFYSIAVLFLFLALLALVLVQCPIGIPKASRHSFQERINLFRRLRNLFFNKHLKVLMITSTCFTLGVDIFYEFGPVFLTEKWVLTPSSLVFYNAAVCIGLVMGNGWFPSFLSSKVSTRRSLVFSMIGFSLFLASIPFLHSRVMIVILFFLAGIAIGLTVTLLTVKISDSASDSIQGEVMGTQLSLRVLGDGIICLFGGFLLILSSKIILVVSSLFSLGAMLYGFKKKL